MERMLICGDLNFGLSRAQRGLGILVNILNFRL
jgi:hypothetical protein